MADSGTRPEIEDVLSSIRRLVSQDTRAPVAVQSHDSQPDPLVLTPALLVSQDTPEAPADTLGADVAPDRARTAETAAASPPALRGATNIGAPQDWEPDFDDSAAQDWPQAEALYVAPCEDATGLGDELSQLEDTIARLEAEVSDSEVEFEAETGDPFGAEGMAPLADLPETFDEAALRAESDEGARDAVQSPLESAAVPLELSDTTTGVEALTGAPENPDLAEAETLHEAARFDPQSPQDATAPDAEDPREAAEPDASMTPPRRLHLEDAAELHFDAPRRESSYETTRQEIAEEDICREGVELEGEAEAGALIDARLPIDEDALQALVADLIRQELQGAMGARITRNLRKLVRREVQRALVSRDLE